MRRGAAIILMLLLAGTAARAEPLLLEIWINGRNTHVVARVEEKDGKFKIANADLAEAGLAVAREGMAWLDAKSDIRAEEDAAGQRLLLTRAPSGLARTTLDLRPSITEDVTPAGRGAMLSYNLSATANDVSHVRNTSSAGAALALTLFEDNMRFTATGFATAGLSARSARLDTALEFDTPSAPRRVVLGDAITGVPEWARSVRFGGIEIATDFSQQPDRVTVPLPQFFGTAAVPSTVDVFVGASRVFGGSVSDGPFALENLPVMTGGGSATVVVRDVLGRETTQTISLYTDPQLLRDGLSSYAVDAGFLRRDYGVSSANYATPFFSATWRRGFSGFTAETHSELAQMLALASAGLASNIESLGVFALDIAASRHHGHEGAMASARLAANTGAFSFFGDIAATAGRFADLASLSGDVFPRLRYEAGLSSALRHNGSVSLSWIGSRMNGSQDDLATASYSLSLGDGLFFGLTGFRDFSDRSWAGQVFFSVPFGDGLLSTSASTGSAASEGQMQFDKSVDPDGGFGYRLLAGTRAAQRAEADATWIGARGELDGAVALSNGQAALRANASGGLVFLGNHLYATRRPDGAVALVEAGAPDVRIYRENRVVSRSGADGNALLTGLNPYAANRIGVEPRDYPLDTDIADTSRIVVPPRGAGVVVKLAPAAHHSFVAVIRLADGSFPPVGALVRLRKPSPPLIVGRDGEVYFGDLRDPADVSIAMGDRHCDVRIVPPAHASGRIARTGPFICRSEASHAL